MKLQKIIRLGTTYLFLCLGAFNSESAPDSQLQLEADNIDWHGGTRVAYDVFDAGEYAQTVYFKVRLTGPPTPFFVTFQSLGAPGPNRQATQGGSRIQYQIYNSLARRTSMRDLPTAPASELLTGVFGPGESTKELSFVIIAPPEQVRPSGFYTDHLKITVYRGTPASFVEKDTKTVAFSVRVDPVTELSLGDSGAVFEPRATAQRLNFGALDKGKAKGFDLMVRSNTGYHVVLESENGGVMKHTDPHFKTTIPYTLLVGGAPAGLGHNRQTILSRKNWITGANGDRHQLSVAIGDVGNATAGTYQDNLIVTIVSDN